MNALLKRTFEQFAGKGGGNRDFARGRLDDGSKSIERSNLRTLTCRNNPKPALAEPARSYHPQKKRVRKRCGIACKSSNVKKSIVPNSRSIAGGPQSLAEISR